MQTSMTMVTVIGLVGMAAAGVFLLGCFRRERPWAEVALGELGRLRTPAELRERPRDPDITQDYAAFTFQRVHDTHLNGQTSYAEELQITVFAEDLEMERIERGTHAFGYASILSRPKDDVVEQLTVGHLQWKVTREIYERHPVREPSWRVLALDRERRVLLDWRGFQKKYSLAEAKQHVQALLDALSLTGDRKAYFAALRDWPADSWRENYAANLAALGTAVEGEWRTDGPWRLAIDTERPRRFVLLRRLGATPNPDGPMTFHGPVTRYRFQGQYLWQDNQGGGGGMLGQDLLEKLRVELEDPAAFYYYSVQTINLWKQQDSIDAEVKEMRRKFDSLQKEYDAGRLVTPSERR